MPYRRVRVLLALGLLVLILAGGWVWRVRHTFAMGVTIRVTGEKTRADVQHVSARVPLGGTAQSVTYVDIDLHRWAGGLARVDLEGTLTGGLRRHRAGTVGYAAVLRNGEHERPVEFVGWENHGQERFHFGQLGPVSLKGPTREGHAFAYNPEGRLWQVFPVRPGDTLRVYLTPLPEADTGGRRETYLPLQPKSWLASPLGSRPQPAPSVFLYLMDACRADRLGAYGYGRPTSPNIDRFAKQAVVYEQAQATATVTGPSAASIFTGLYPTAHGLVHMISDHPDKLADWPVTLPEALHAAGYRTMLITANGHTSGHYGFLQGVDRSAYVTRESAAWADAQAASFLQGVDPQRPVFMYLHTIETHFPYEPKPGTWRLLGLPRAPAPQQVRDQRGAQPAQDAPSQRDAYDCGVRDVDTAFGQFVAYLTRTGRFDNSLIVVLADHGEALGERGGFGHGDSLNVEETHVPLLIHYPKGRYAGTRVTVPVSLVDLYPTVMAATGTRPRLGYELPGRDLAVLAAAPTRAPRVPVYFEVADGLRRWDLVGVLDEDGYKRVWDLLPRSGKNVPRQLLGLWDTRADPGERVDLTASRPVRAAYEEALMAHYLVAQRWWRGPATPGAAVTTPLTDEMRANLKRLGYLK